MTRCVIYAAKSTTDRKGSIPDQLADCREMASRQGWEIVSELSDEGFSAFTGNRGPGLVAAKAAAARSAEEDGEAILLVWASDRLARGAGDAPGAAVALTEVYHELARLNVSIRSVKDDSMLTNPLLVAFAAWRGNEESRVKSERVKAGSRRRAERGDAHGGPTPYGYRRHVDPATGNRGLAVEPAEAAIVERIYAEFVAGRSQKQIARGLEADGIRTKLGTTWTQSQVGRILCNPLYRGIVTLKGEQRDGNHRAIISDDLWERVAALRNATARTRGTGRGRLSEKHLLVRGTLRCSCGASMNCRSSQDTYQCATHVRDPDACPQSPVPRAVIDSAILAHFELVGLDLDATRAALQGNLDRELACMRALREQAEQAERNIAGSLSRVKDDYLAGKLPAHLYAEHRAELEPAAEAASAEADQLRRREARLAAVSIGTAEEELVSRIDALRAAIAGEVTGATGIAAVRAALLTIFESFTLYAEDADDRPRVVKDELSWKDTRGRRWFLTPTVREQVIVDRYERTFEMMTGWQADEYDLFVRQMPLDFPARPNRPGPDDEPETMTLSG